MGCDESENGTDNPDSISESVLYSLDGIELNGWDEGVFYHAGGKGTSFYIFSHKDSLDGSFILCVSPADNEDADAALLFQYGGDMNLYDVFYAGYRFSARVNADSTAAEFTVYNNKNEVEGSFSVPMVPIGPDANTRSPFFNSNGNFSVTKTVDFGRLVGNIYDKVGGVVDKGIKLAEGNYGDPIKDFLLGKTLPPLPKSVPIPGWLQRQVAEWLLKGCYDKIRDFYMGQAEIQVSSVKRTSETALTVQGIVSGLVTVPPNRCVLKYGVVVGKNKYVGYTLCNLRLGPERVTGKSSQPFTFTLYAERQPGQELYFRPYLIPEFASEGYYSPITFIRYGVAKRFLDMEVKLKNFKQEKVTQTNEQYTAQFTIDGSIPGAFSELSNWGFDVKTTSGTTTRFYAKESDTYYPPTNKSFTCNVTLKQSDFTKEGGEQLATITLTPFISLWNSMPPMVFFDPQDYTLSLCLSCPDNNHPHAIDLGLPSGTKWSCCNVGASKPEDYGDYFAWGETMGYKSGKTNFTWSTYKWCQGSAYTMTKYNTDSSHDTVDAISELQPSDDAATANWGSGWQMPSIDQCSELINGRYTTTEWTTVNGINGRKITSKTNGNSIFLPAAGCRYDTSLCNAGSDGFYWSRSLDTSHSSGGRNLSFNSSMLHTSYGGDRFHGQSVRPVLVQK